MLRVFLLTLAVVDDFIAIAVIAVFYTDELQWIWLGLALIPLAVYATLAQRSASWFTQRAWAAWLILLPLGALTWAMVHASGIHATIAGVLLAFTVPVRARASRALQAEAPATGDRIDLAETFNERFGPLSNALAVPVFAFFSAGVAVSAAPGFWSDPVALGVIIGLLLGKPLGIGLTTWLLMRATGTSLGGARLREIIGVSCLGGIGFTVAMLVSELSFPGAEADTARLAVMAGSVASALLAAAFLARRPRSHTPT